MKWVALIFLFIFYATFLSSLSSHRLVQGNAISSRYFLLFGAKSILGFACEKLEKKHLLLISVHTVPVLDSKKGFSLSFKGNTGQRNPSYNFNSSSPVFLPKNGGTLLVSGSCKLSEMCTIGIKKHTLD